MINDDITSDTSNPTIPSVPARPIFSSSSLFETTDSKTDSLKSAKQSKLSNFNQGASLDNSYSQADDGSFVSNRNKIHNDLSDSEHQNLLEYIKRNLALTRNEEGQVLDVNGQTYDGRTRRFYGFGTKDDTNEQIKFGLARGDLDGSEGRYIPNEDGTYGWESGSLGVDPDKKFMDLLLPDNVAVMFEGLTHGRKKALENRIIGKNKKVDNSPYTEFIHDEKAAPLSREELREQTDAVIKELITSDDYNDYGSGGSEYYTSLKDLLGEPVEYNEEQGKEVFSRFITDMEDRFPKNGIVDQDAYFKRKLAENRKYAAERYGVLDRFGNTLSGFGSTFVSELIVNPLDAVGDLTGMYDLGTEEEKTEYVNNAFGYNSASADAAMEEVGKQWDILSNSELSDGERLKAAANGVLEAFLTPELLGTSLGALMSWVTPGVVLKAIGVGSKFAMSVKAIDKLVEAGTVSKTAAKGLKLQKLATVNGAKAAVASQSGFMFSALGNVNNQYNEFVENNNGLELEGAEKAQWFAGRFAVQMVNQNLDKIVAIDILKNPGAIAALVPALKAMSNKEFANFGKYVGLGLLKTTKNVSEEVAQEYTQTMMELYNSRFGSAQFKDADDFKSFMLDKRNTREAGIGSLAGAGGAGQFDLAGGATPAVVGIAQGVDKGIEAVKNKTTRNNASTSNEFAPEVPEQEISEEQITANTTKATAKATTIVEKYVNLIGDEELDPLATTTTDKETDDLSTPVLKKGIKDNISDYTAAIEEIEEAEAVLESTEEDTAVELKVLRKAKREIFNNIMDEDSPTLGSNYTPEDVVEDFLDVVDVVDGKLTLTSLEEAKLNKFVKDNDIPPLRYKNLREGKIKGKDANEVQKDIFDDGPKSASTYRKTLRTLVNTPNPDRKKIASVLGSINQFLNSQENRSSAYDSALNEITSDIAAFNKRVSKTSTLSVADSAEKTRLKRGINEIKGYDNAFVAVNEKADGTLTINSQSLATSNSIKDNIAYLNRTKARYEARANTLIGNKDPSSDKGIFVRPSSKNKAARDTDAALYDKRGVTKIIVDPKASGLKWSVDGDYQKDNQGKINTGNYTEDDVIVINSKSKSFPKSNVVRNQLKKAYDAGASIVLDNDQDTQESEALHKLLNNYHFRRVKQDNLVTYIPKAKAEPILAKQKEDKKKVDAKANTLKKLIEVLDMEDAVDGDKSKFTSRQTNFYNKIIEDAKQYFPGGIEKMRERYTREIKKLVEKESNSLVEIAVTEGVDSAQFSEAIIAAKSEYSESVFDKIDEATNKKVQELENGEELIAAWNNAYKESKKGNLDLNKWIKDNINNPMQIIKGMFNSAIGKGKKTVYAYLPKENSTSFSVTTNKDKIRKDKEGNTVNYQELEIDPNKYAVVDKATPLNTLNLKELQVSGNLQFNKIVKKAKELLSKTITKPNLQYKNIVGSTHNFLDFSNSPVSSLIFDQDLELNENASVAIHIGLKNFLKDNAYLVMKGKKSKKDLAEILGIDESQISREAVEMLKDKGLLYKTAANSIGKDIAAMLGLSRKSDSEADIQLFDALTADLGQTALLMGVKEGILEIDNTLDANKFAETVLKKDKDAFNDNNKAKVIFIQAVSGRESEIEKAVAESKNIADTIPETSLGRKEPLFAPISKEEKQAATKKIRKEKLGLVIADESEEAMNELMDTEWSADLVLMREMVDNEKSIKKLLGWVKLTGKKFDKLSFEEKESQPSINRAIEKSFEEMRWLLDNSEGDNVSLYFKYFFSKNGRFFMDSNTINPQNDKHLHRFAVQPKSHINKFKHKAGNFFVGTKDVTANVHYALAQGFGFATDKRDTAKIKEHAEKILKELNTLEKLQEAKAEFLKSGEVERLGIEIEHLGHALQSFAFIEKMLTGKEFESSLSAEFDAVTSGFGIKNLQMPIIEDMSKWLKKVGVLFNDDEILQDSNINSMNDVLDEGGVQDSYQTLASGIKGFTFEGMLAEIGNMFKGRNANNAVVTDSIYSRNLWEALENELPKVVDDIVSPALRNLFKYPFMTFNYAASIKSIRKNLLTGDLISSITKDMARVDINDKESSTVKLMQAFVGKKGSVKNLQEQIRTKSLYTIKGPNGSKSTLEAQLSQMIEASYGAKVEEILTKEFGPFMEAQDNVNNGFKAMFEVFSISFEKELEDARKEGPISIEKERAIYSKLKDKWPMIKGPLSNMEEEFESGDGIGIYDTKTASPYGAYSGRKPARANLSKELVDKLGQDTIRVSHMVKQMVAAIAAGSVLPIHYIDGAIMARTINSMKGKGLTSIHDAIIPSLVDMGEGQKEYNKHTVETNAGYSFINEIVKTLDRFIDTIPKDDPRYTDRKVDIVLLGEKESVSVLSFLYHSRNHVAHLANNVNKGREALFEQLNKGAKIMHMAGTAEGVYDVTEGAIKYKPVDKYAQRKYTSDIKVKSKSRKDLSVEAKNKKCKG